MEDRLGPRRTFQRSKALGVKAQRWKHTQNAGCIAFRLHPASRGHKISPGLTSRSEAERKRFPP